MGRRLTRRRLRRRVRSRQLREHLERSGPWIGVGGLVAVVLLSISSFRLAPWWGVVVYLAVDLALMFPLARLARTHPARCVWVPVAGVLAWLVITLAGFTLGGWTA